MNVILKQLLQAKIDWQTTNESAYIFQTLFDRMDIRLRLNDFPDQPLCTIIIDGQAIDLHEFPKSWTLPRHRGGQQ
jgi:hypothetical protein